MSNIRVFCIGSDATEFYAAHTEQEMREYYVKLVGAEQAALDIADYFEEVPQSAMDEEFEMDCGGKKKVITTWRKQVADAVIPCQISTSYL